MLIGASAIQLDGDVVVRLHQRCIEQPALGHLHDARVRARLRRLREALPVIRTTATVVGGGAFLGASGLAPEALPALLGWLGPGALGVGAGYLTPRGLRWLIRARLGRYGRPKGDPEAAQ